MRSAPSATKPAALGSKAAINRKGPPRGTTLSMDEPRAALPLPKAKAASRSFLSSARLELPDERGITLAFIRRI